jgi:hypothetical protein
MTGKKRWTFGNPIKLTLSGGGYRAASFHLGTLSYLQRIGLLDEVDTLSTVSGGTFTGMRYAISLKEKTGFDAFYRGMYAFLRDTNILEESLAMIGDATKRAAAGDYNLITAFAEFYHQKITGGRLFGIFLEPPAIHLKEIIFNATEFRTGLAFRFQKSAKRRALIGNFFFPVPPEVAKTIRLADILAASSAFPGGCEPISFPGDFAWPGDRVPELPGLDRNNPLPLMDGGVYDNQGIESALLADVRTKNKIGAFIISDVDAPGAALYRFPDSRKKGLITLGMINALSIAAIILLLISSAFQFLDLAVSFRQEGLRWVRDLFMSLIPLSLTALLSAGLIWIDRARRKYLEKFAPEVGPGAWKQFRRLTLDQFLDMLELRISSLTALTSSVFMSRIRRLLYRRVYDDPKYEGKRISNLIYDLAWRKKKPAAPWLAPSPEMIKIAESASRMATTFWFTKEQDLKNIVACGQFTMCYNLLEFILRNHKERVKVPGSKIGVVFRAAREDWKRFREDPYFMAVK